MFEFTSAYLKPFNWATTAYEYMLGQTTDRQVSVTQESLIGPSTLTIPYEPVEIYTDGDWNRNSTNQLKTIAGLYKSVDQAEEYFNSLYTTISSRMAESEKRIQEQDSTLRVLLSSSKLPATTSIHIRGGDTSSIETNENYYKTFGPLQAVPNEGTFRLKDTGFFSSIRSLGGFAGSVEIEFSLGQIKENGTLSSIVDGARNTFWTGTYYAPAPIKADQNDVPWLPDEYKHGFAFMLTYYLDRPSVATEVYVEPVITEPIDLVSICWTPINLSNQITEYTFASSAGWVYNGTATWLSSSACAGVDLTACACVTSSSGYVSQTFSVSGSYLASGSTLVGPGRRCSLSYAMRGVGDLYAGARIVWFNASGDVIEYKIKEDYPTAFFSGHRLVDYIPIGATSGRVDLGVFTPSVSASAFFDNVILHIGEREFQVQELIDRPKTISLPEITRSGRYSFVFAQRNPRREILAKESPNVVVQPIVGDLYIDQTIQNATNNLIDKLYSKGPGTSTFAYRIGFKELDLRYREHIPRGSIVSLPLVTRREIREVWATAELGQYYNDNNFFYIYPFANDPSVRTQVQPFGIGEVDAASTTLIREGEILRIYTSEEYSNGWVYNLDKYFITDPKSITETFDGTDRDGKITLTYPPHLRRVLLKAIQDWNAVYSIWGGAFDPNLETMYGLPASMSETVNAIREGTASGFNLDSLVSREGYIPIKVSVFTDKWTAYPDTFGRPDISKVRVVKAETLTETTVVETTVETVSDDISYDAWIAETTTEEFQILAKDYKFLYSIKGEVTKPIYKGLSLKEFLDKIRKKRVITYNKYTMLLKSLYKKLKAKGALTKDSQNTKTTTSAVEVDDVFTTKYKPIVYGPNGTFIQLYWYDPISVTYLPMARSDYEVRDSSLGIIRILSAAPGSGYTSVLADYKYISYSDTEDHYSSIISFTLASTSVTGINSNLMISSRPYPITRNLTDYENGKVPTLKDPNFDRLSKDYYPVIEYYVTPDGEIIFSRDFFKYGDIPARILVEYDSLQIQPRVGIETTRSGSPSVTPTIYNISMRVRESSPLPIRENN